MYDISGWDGYHFSHGTCKCWDGVPDEVKQRALEMMRELRDMCAYLDVNIEVWSLSEEIKQFVRSI